MAMTGKDWFRMAFDPGGEILEKNNLNPWQWLGGPSPAEATGMTMLTGGKQLEEDMKPKAPAIFLDTEGANRKAQMDASGGSITGPVSSSGTAGGGARGWSSAGMQPYLAEALRGSSYT